MLSDERTEAIPCNGRVITVQRVPGQHKDYVVLMYDCGESYRKVVGSFDKNMVKLITNWLDLNVLPTIDY